MEAMFTKTFPFLSLPLELRMVVYIELLGSNMGRTLPLYNDQSGRSEKLDIHPSILQVNSQIYVEASPVLYDQNIFEIDLSSTVGRHSAPGEFPETRSDHLLPLFRCDTAPNNLPVEPNGRCVFAHNRSSGLIYPHCFQRLRQLELVTSYGAAWGKGSKYNCFSITGDVILEILRNLAKRNAHGGNCKKTFTVTTKLCVRRLEENIFAVEVSNPIGTANDDRRPREEEKVILNVLLQAVSKQRKVTLKEDLQL